MKRPGDSDRERGHADTSGSPVARLPLIAPVCLTDLEFWINTDPRIASRLLRLIRETLRDPLGGIGKPEPLIGERGIWSRRITDEHRLTYRVTSEHVHFLQARFHYSR
jgi:toxin YoeB